MTTNHSTPSGNGNLLQCSIYSLIPMHRSLPKMQPASYVTEILGKFLVWSV